MESKKFLREIFDIEENAHNYIITLFDEHNFNELVLTDDSNEIIYITENNDVKCEKVKVIKINVFNEDDIVFQTISGAYIPYDICVRGTIAQYAPIIEGEFERIKNTIETQNNKIKNNDFTYSKKYFFLPDSKNPGDLTPEQFCDRAFLQGEVMTAEEYAERFNNCQLGNIQPECGVLKMYDYVDHIVEFCPHCENEVVLDAKFQKQYCPICNKLIKPCSMCDICTNPCPLADDE